MTSGAEAWHTTTPAVYLDQWVWIRFARVVNGNPQEPGDKDVLSAVVAAAGRGIMFPLSATHYEETLRIRDPRQRQDLSGVMAPISKMCTLRKQSDLVSHQLLVAIHEIVGRPVFRPVQPQVLGRGVSWAFQGINSQLRVLGPDGAIQRGDSAWLRHAGQCFEAQVLAGPGDDEIPELRADGYLEPRELEKRPGNRLDWERLFAERLAKKTPQPSRTELRIWLLARELIHEYMDDLTGMLMDYRLTFAAVAGGTQGKRARQKAVEFAERVPTLRIAADMKLEMFRNPSRPWTQNMVRDIDAISLSLPYCRVLVADRDAVNLLRRSDAPARYNSHAIYQLAQLPELLSEIDTEQPGPADVAGWDEVGPGEGYHIEPPGPMDRAGLPAGYRVRLCGPEGPLTDRLDGAEPAA